MNALFLVVIVNYFAIMLLIRWYWSKPTIQPSGRPSAKADVVVACRNESSNLHLLLPSLVSQQTSDMNIIMVDDHSTDETLHVATALLHNHGTVLSSAGQGKKEALKTGAQHASNPWLIFLDADVILPPQWCQRALSFLGNTDAEVVMFPVAVNASHSLGSLEELDFLSLMTTTASTANMRHATMANGAAFAVKREVWLALNDQLHPQILSGDDVFLVHAAKHANHKLNWAHNPSLIITVPGATNVTALISQRIRWGKKSGRYTDPFTIYLAWSVLLFSVVYTFVLLIAVVSWSPILLVGLLVSKVAIDYLVLVPPALWFNKRNRIIHIFWVSIVHPMFILTTALLGFVVPTYWKGRRI